MNDTPDVYEEKVRKARKDHICCECGEIIQSGDEYVYCHGIWEGYPAGYKQCKECNDLMKKASRMNYSKGGSNADGPALGYLFEWINNFADKDGNWMADELEADNEF